MPCFQWDVAPLLDNRASHRVYYKVSVYTGLRQNSGTKSKTFLVMYGDNGDTGVRELDDGRGKVNIYTRLIFHQNKIHVWAIEMHADSFV